MSRKKPAIPEIPKPGQDRRRFDSAVKEALEIIMGRRIDPIEVLGLLDFTWDDYLGSINAAKVTGASQPTWTNIPNTGLYENGFSASAMNECWVDIHILHTYAFGTRAYPHIHWKPTNTNTGVVRWGVELGVTKGHSQEALTSSSIVYLEQAGSGTAYMHQIIEATDAQSIAADHLEPDSLVQVRVFRDAAHVNDTYNAVALGTYCDLHVLVDGRRTTTKTPNWIKADFDIVRLRQKINEMLGVMQ